MFKSMLLACALLTCLSACAFRSQTTGMAMEHNQFVAQTTNNQTVLNILRAREREPMHFTSLSLVRGEVRGQGTMGLNVAINGDSSTDTATDVLATTRGSGGEITSSTATATQTTVSSFNPTNLTPSLGLQVNTGTNFDVAINATSEFYRGILGPLSASTIVHFLRQGYPADVLSYLLIGRLEFYARIKPPGGDEQTVLLLDLRNTPDDRTAAAEFANAIRCRQLSYVAYASPARRVSAGSLADFSGIAPDILSRVETVNPASSPATPTLPYAFSTPSRNEFRIALSTPVNERCVHTRTVLETAMAEWVEGAGLIPRLAESRLVVNPNPLEGQDGGSGSAPGAEAAISEGLTGTGGATFRSEGYFNNQLPQGYTGDLEIEMTIRSVEGALYFLGEYVRDETASPKLWSAACPETNRYCMPIIRIRPAREISAAQRFAEVEYRGDSYAVPLSGSTLTPAAGRSSQVISLVQQLLNLHRSASDLPSTPLVRVTN